MSEKTLDIAFYVSLLLKALNAGLEVVLGLLLLITGEVGTIIAYLARGELIEDQTDFLAGQANKWLPHLTTNVEHFGAYYLLSHGAIKILLVWALFKRRPWAYPTAIVVFILFILFQLWKYSSTHSILVLLLTVFDTFVVWVIWKEYATHVHRSIVPAP